MTIKIPVEFWAASGEQLDLCITAKMLAQLAGMDKKAARIWVQESHVFARLRAKYSRIRPREPMEPLDYVKSRCSLPSDSRSKCWIWQRSVSKQGVPQMHLGEYSGPVRRWLYEQLNPGPQPKGMRIVSACLDESCVSPYCMRRLMPSQYGRWLHKQHINSSVKSEGARRGAKLRKATMSDAEVANIRRLKAEQDLHARQIARIIGRSHHAVWAVLSGRTHKLHASSATATTVADARTPKPINVEALAAQASVFLLGQSLAPKAHRGRPMSVAKVRRERRLTRLFEV